MNRITQQDIDYQVKILNIRLHEIKHPTKFVVNRAYNAYRLENESGGKDYLVGMAGREMYDCLRAMNMLMDELFGG